MCRNQCKTRITGDIVSKDLRSIFNISGNPVVIVKDNDYTLNLGVKLYNERYNIDIKVVGNITHVIANIYKKHYEKTKSYQLYMNILRTGATRLRQTDLSFLIPPKLRKKAMVLGCIEIK